MISKAGVVVDSWKREIFERHLKAAGYVYTVGPGITRDTLVMTVQVADPAPLKAVLLAANTEAAQTKGRVPPAETH